MRRMILLLGVSLALLGSSPAGAQDWYRARRGLRFRADSLVAATRQLHDEARVRCDRWDRGNATALTRLGELEQRALELRDVVRGGGDADSEARAAGAVSEAWARAREVRAEILDCGGPGSALAEDFGQVGRAVREVASVAGHDGGWRERGEREVPAPPVLPAGTRIVAEFRHDACSNDMPVNSGTDVRMYLSEEVRIRGKVLPQGAPLGVAALSAPGSQRRGAAAGLRLMLRGVSDTRDWWEVSSQVVGFQSNGRWVSTSGGDAGSNPRAVARGSQVCFPAGTRIAFVLDQDSVLSPERANR